MQSQVHDFLYDYKDQDTPGFQTYISGKYEFRQLASDVKEAIPKRGSRFTHQELLLRFMKAYDRCLIMHDTGTGKTCTACGPSESFKEEWFKATIDYTNTYINGQPGNIRRVIVFTKSETLEKEFRRQLVCKCTPYESYEQKIERANPGMGVERAITNNLDVFYEFQHYRSFGNWFAKKGMEGIEVTLRDLYSDVLFICDEIQDLITEDWDIEKRDKDQDKTAYNALFTLFHAVPNIKVMLMSATPMIDKVREIIPIMNLILPLERQIPIDFDLERATLEQMEPYFRGRISFVRALDTGAIPEYQGEMLGGDYHTVVYKTSLISNSIQDEVYRRVNAERNSYEAKSRQASLFVFPDGSIGEEGMNNYFTFDKSSNWYTWKNEEILRQQNKPSLLANLNNTDDLRNFSAKYATMIELIEGEPGSHFIYFDFVKVGTDLFGMLLERFGYERFTGTTSAFDERVSGGKTKYCSASQDVGALKREITKKKRYAIITSTTDKPKNILDLMNSPLNVDGEYIKVLLVSQVGRTGINVSNIRTGHLAGPSWNYSNTYQALSRFLRATSHVDLIEKIALTTNKSVSDTKVTVKIFQHCLTDPRTETVDVYLYMKSEDKDRSIKRIFRYMKQCAIDCQIHHRRNARSTDIDGSPICDYQECDYKCVDPEPTTIDYSSFNTIYAGAEIKKIQEIVKDIFRKRASIHYDELSTQLQQQFRHDAFEMKFLLDRAIRELIDTRTALHDRYGFRSFLQEDGKNLYIQRDYPSMVKDVSLSLYSSNVIGVKSTTLSAFMRGKGAVIPENVATRLRSIDNLDDMYSYLRSLPLDTQITVLEDALVERCINHNTPLHVELIIRVYILNIYWFQEPVAKIESIKLSLQGKKLVEATKRGRKLTKKAIVQVQLPEYGNLVYIHTLRSRETGGVLYASTASKSKLLGLMRIMNGEEGYFRDVEPYEVDTYLGFIQKVNAERTQPFLANDIYGSYEVSTGKFRIVDNRSEPSTDLRERNRGKVCDTWPKPDLIHVASHLNAGIPPIGNVSEEDMRDYLRRYHRYNTSLMTPQQILYTYAYLHSDITVSGICDVIFNHLLNNNIIHFE